MIKVALQFSQTIDAKSIKKMLTQKRPKITKNISLISLSVNQREETVSLIER